MRLNPSFLISRGNYRQGWFRSLSPIVNCLLLMYDIFLTELSIELLTVFHVRYGKSVDECRIWEVDSEMTYDDIV